jgi:hypothetical protein
MKKIKLFRKFIIWLKIQSVEAQISSLKSMFFFEDFYGEVHVAEPELVDVLCSDIAKMEIKKRRLKKLMNGDLNFSKSKELPVSAYEYR